MEIRVKNAVIVKIGAIGDAVMALPLARELKSRGFNRITWVAGADIRPVVNLATEISEQITINERALFGSSKLKAVGEVLRTWWKLRDLHPSHVYLLHADKRYRLLIPPWLRSSVSTVRVGSRRHHTFDYARMAFPEKEDHELKFEPYVLASTAKREERICIFPGGAKNALRDNPLRRWPIENYVALCEKLLDANYNVSIIGGPSDSWIEPSFTHLKSKVEWNVGNMKLQQTVKYLQQSTLAISHDTGPVHLSSLADCPIITIFGPTNSEWFAPIKYTGLVIELSPKLPCQPCYDGKEFGACANNICISSLSASQVFSRAQAFLAHGK